MTPPPPRSPEPGFPSWLVALAALVAALFACYYFVWMPHRDALVVYCAHDSIYADQILHEFEQQTGISVAVRYDTEATKSGGRVELLLQEKAHPRCDVFWNNELLGTLQLADEDMLLALSRERLRTHSRRLQGSGRALGGIRGAAPFVDREHESSRAD